MDLHVERQCVEQMKGDDPKKFLLLFDANFESLYKYIFRRAGDSIETEKIIRLTFLDALGQVQNTPTDIGYIIWLYSLAKPRVWDFIGKASFPEKQGLISVDKSKLEQKGEEEFVEKIQKMFKKLSLEEREILWLKFFEEVSDGDVMTVLGTEEGVIGPKIYRVLKRAHLLLFGESDEKQGVYFGELSGLLSRARELEKIEIPQVLRLSLRADLEGRIERKEGAIDAEEAEEVVEMVESEDFMTPEFVRESKDLPFATKEKAPKFKGSDDPAKIFVEAVKEMKEEEKAARLRDEQMLEREEMIMNFINRWKWVLVLVPIVIIIGMVLVFRNTDFGGEEVLIVERGYPTNCDIEIEFVGDFTDGEKRSVNKGVSDKLCNHFEVEKLSISRADSGKVDVKVDIPDWLLEYNFVKKVENWRIKKYARTFDSNREPREIYRNIRRS